MVTDVLQLRGTWRYPTTVHFGLGRIEELPELCRSLGMERPLLVTDPGLAGHAMVAEVLTKNRASGLVTGLFSDIQPNPVRQNILDGVAALQKGRHDGVVGFGGGSALDAAKVIALLAAGDPATLDVATAVREASPGADVPVIAVPTTAGTGSEVGRAAVITNVATQTKEILLHPLMMPNAVIADPGLTVSLPRHLTAATGMDALAHNLEAYYAPFYHPMADGIALEGIRLIHDWLPRAVEDGSDLVARAYMLTAASMGAAAFQKGLGAIHSLSHPLGVLYGVHHGLANAIVMPYVLAYNREAIDARIGDLARYLDLAEYSFDGFLDWVVAFRERIGIPATLAEVGVGEEQLDRLAEMAFEDPNTEENPVPLDVADFKQLYRNAIHGRL